MKFNYVIQTIRHYSIKIIKPVGMIFFFLKYRIKNPHNLTIPKNFFRLEGIHIWEYTYWSLEVHSFWIPGELTIGNYCSISHDVTFILWGNHTYKRLLTYPLGIMNSIPWAQEKEYYTNWKIEIGDDVWIGTGAKIMSWVTVWQWAIIAAYAVVTQSIPPYAIVWWVPAKIIKYRFPTEVIEKLVKIDYNDIPISKLLSMYNEISKEWFDVDKVCDLLK